MSKKTKIDKKYHIVRLLRNFLIIFLFLNRHTSGTSLAVTLNFVNK